MLSACALAYASALLDLPPPLLVLGGALLGSAFLFTLLPPAPPSIGDAAIAPKQARALKFADRLSGEMTPTRTSSRRPPGRMRRISTEIAEGMAYRAASIIVDDDTKRGLAEMVMASATQGAMTDEASIVELDANRTTHRVSVSRMKRVSMSVPIKEGLPDCANLFVGEWEFIEQVMPAARRAEPIVVR